MLFIILSLSCASHAFGPKKPEPVIEWCSLYEDGFGECRQRDGSYLTKSPLEMKNYIATSPEDMAVYRTYCRRRED